MPVIVFMLFLAWLGNPNLDYNMVWYLFLSIIIICGVSGSRSKR